MTTEKNIHFSFRNKFEKLLNDGNRRNIMFVFQKFCRLEPDEASEFLWRLTSSNEEYRSKLLDRFGLVQEMIPSESFLTFKNELRHQYEKLYPNALTAVVPECCQKAFDVLKGATDVVTATVVYQHCKEYVSWGDVERVISFLQSDEERIFCGGILELGFRGSEVQYLKPFCMKIHDLLKAVCDYRQENDDSYDDGNLPFANLGNLIQAAGLKLANDTQEASKEVPEEHQHQEEETAVATPAEEPIQLNNEFKTLTSEEGLNYREVFKHFVSSGDANVLVLISSIGFDLNEIIAKKEEIRNLIQAHENMVEAQYNWNKAKESLEKAQSNLTKATQMFDGKETDLQKSVE